MKKVLLPILFLLMALTAISQNLVQITGTVTDLTSGAPISNQAVTISNDSSGGWIYYQTVYTNNSGFYADTVPVQLNSQGTLFVRTIDCQNFMHQQVLTYMPSMLVFTADFAICYNNSPCQANFTSQQTQPLVVQFTDASLGGGTTRLWDFGDGATSTAMNPLHAYSSPGYYGVSLTIGALGTTCYNTTVQNVYVSDTTSGGCQASFYVVPDSMNTGNTYQFFDQSSGNINSWAWNFGDPASGANNTSTLQNPTHTYSQPGTYSACLTIQGIDSTCYDMTCVTIVVGMGGGCNAEFSYYNDTVSSTPTIHFNDLSTAGMGYINKWMWDFGDGQTLTVEYPMNPNVEHTYAQPGTYNVCLSIFANDSTCYDMTCHPVATIANSECDAQFSHSIPISTAYPTYFIDESTAGGGLPITSWYWNFGDPASGANNTSTLQNPTHLFTAQGTFIVCLTIQGADSSCYDMTCQEIIVAGDSGCQANFNYNVSPTGGNYTVYFNDLSTGNPISWFWSFGDGTSSNVQNPIVHTYAGPGSYNVCLTITGNNCTSTFCQVVVVQDSVVYHQVYGQVFAGNFPISLGLAMIFSLDTGANYTPYFAVCPIDSNGVYYFTTVPDGNYYIMAIPFDSNGYMPTYYGNTINWEDATLVSLGTPNNPYNINCVAYTPMMPGPGSTSGQINTGDVVTSMVDKINMIVLNEQGIPVGFTDVSASGAFSFPSMPYGTYYLHAEMPGVTSQNIRIILTPEKPHADVVMTFSGNSILGIRDEVTLVNRWSAYPNPVIDNLNLSIDMKQGTEAEAGIYNLTGQKVAGMQVTLQAGNNSIVLPTASLPIGIYTLRIHSQEGVILTSKLVRTR